MKTLKLKIITIALLILSGCGKDDGDMSPKSGENQPPQPFNLIAIADGSIDVEVIPTFSWELATDPNEDIVEYDVLLDTVPDPETIVVEELTETEYIPENPLSLVTEYFWRVIAKDGQGGETESEVFSFTTRSLKDAQQATGSADFTARDKHASVAFDSKIWVIGGFLSDGSGGFGKDVWFSENGETWTEATVDPDQSFTERFFHDATVFDEKIWVIGGVAGGSFANDVWTSEDGAVWTEIPQTNGFPERAEHAVTVFGGKLWVIGGAGNGAEKLNDVWSSEDGADWTLVTDDAEFSPRNFHQAVAFDDALWVIGGFDDLDLKNDIWKSDDGVTWTEATAEAEFSERGGHRVRVFNDRLWLVGSSNSNDVWFSENGLAWKEVTPETSFPIRNEFTSAVFDNKIWIIGGAAKNDVWYFELD